MANPAPATDLRGRVALVTGASRGIGVAVASALANAGCTLVVVARDRDALRAAEVKLAALGARVRAWAGDVTDGEFMRRVVSDSESQLGPLCLLVNNAGSLGPIGPLADAPPDEWWRCVEVNLRGAALAMQLVLPRMCSRGAGRVINVLSGAAGMVESSLQLGATRRPYGGTMTAVHSLFHQHHAGRLLRSPCIAQGLGHRASIGDAADRRDARGSAVRDSPVLPSAIRERSTRPPDAHRHAGGAGIRTLVPAAADRLQDSPRSRHRPPP